ncbi:MAG: hypothetical protein Q9184_005629, partial [Pyrenodesmia sp. 2 TL-2023]
MAKSSSSTGLSTANLQIEYLNDYIPFGTNNNEGGNYLSLDNLDGNKEFLQVQSSTQAGPPHSDMTSTLQSLFGTTDSISEYVSAEGEGQTDDKGKVFDEETASSSYYEPDTITQRDITRMGERIIFLISRMEERLTGVAERAEFRFQRQSDDLGLGTTEALNGIERRVTDAIERATQKIASSRSLASTRTSSPPTFEASSHHEFASNQGENPFRGEITAVPFVIVDKHNVKELKTSETRSVLPTTLVTTPPGKLIRAVDQVAQTYRSNGDAANDTETTANERAKPSVASKSAVVSPAAPSKVTSTTSGNTGVSSSSTIHRSYYKYFGAPDR